MTNNIEQFNLVIAGVGGQGLISILRILAQAAMNEGYETKTSELHGISQRGGSVEAHLRFGERIFSPLVSQNKADLILGLEMQECLKAAYFAGEKTTFLINQLVMPVPLQEPLTGEEIVSRLEKLTKNIVVVPAAEICQKELGTNVTAGVYLISLAAFKGFIPLKSESILRAIKETLQPKYLEINEKTFNLAQNYAQ